MITTLAGLVVAACILVLIFVLVRAVYRWARPQYGAPMAIAAAAGAVGVAFAVLRALGR